MYVCMYVYVVYQAIIFPKENVKDQKTGMS